MMQRALALAWIASLGATATAASGRDLWLEADSASAAKPGERGLHLREGAGFKTEEERPLQKDRTSRFDLYADQARRRDLLATGQDGQTPVAKLPPEPSACLVVMDRRDPPGTVDAERFNQMLTEAGQEALAAQRMRSGQSGAEGREIVYHYLKALVPGQDPASTLPNTFYKRRVEQRLEILPQNNPGRLPPNHRLAVKVLLEGKPLAGARVLAYRRETTGGGAAVPQAPTPTASPAVTGAGAVSAVTSAQGLAEFKLDQGGLWLLEAVHVRAGTERRTNPSGAWEVFEAAYTLVVKDAPAGPTGAAGGAMKASGGDGK